MHFAQFISGCLIALCYCASSFAEGTLTVKTDPEGIEVWLDDKYIGDSPIVDKKLKAGRYSLKLVDPVQRSSTVEEVFIQNDEATVIEKTIKSKFGTLRVTSDPEGAEVYISTLLGKTPLTNEFMNPGKYQLELKYPNKRYSVALADIVIPKGESVTINKALERKRILDNKAKLRLALGAGTAAGYLWAILSDSDNDKVPIGKPLGIIIGSVCLVGLEIVAFF